VRTLTQFIAATADDLVEHYPNRREHAADLIVHLIGLALALCGGAALFWFAWDRGGFDRAAPTALYSACLTVMLVCSAIYNLTGPNRMRRLLRRMDEAAIFLLIAGSYTPLTTLIMDPEHGGPMTIAVWVIAILGALGKVFLPSISDRFWCLVYIAFGWLSVALVGPLAEKLSWPAMTLLAGGGLVYTSGVLVYLREALPFRRAIWHGFVLSGAGLHYAAISMGVISA
jgi:hemolysin III